MFDTLPNWVWVASAYGEVILAYVGYLLYLRWRASKIDKDRP